MLPEEQMADFAEVCGIHAGDGWMSSYTYEIGYGTNPKEEQYFQEVLQLYKKIFALQRVRILRRLAVEFRFCSKQGQLLLQKVGFVRGRKLDALQAPSFIFEQTEFMKRFIRGLIDTDGHVYWRKSVNNFYLVLFWSTGSLSLASDLLTILRELGYRPHCTSALGTVSDGHTRRVQYRIVLMRMADVRRYLKEIGFRNQRRWLQVVKRFNDLERYDIDKSTITFLRRLELSVKEGPVV